MTENFQFQKIDRITELCTGMSASRIIPLGQGATSAAWYVENERRAVIVRMVPLNTNRPVTYQSEFTILRQLKAKGCLVPKPLLNNAECPNQLTDIPEPWAVTEVINGQAIKKGQLSNQTARELGSLLATVHALPVRNYGRLTEQQTGLKGLQSDHLSGIRARWCWAPIWPFDDCRLETHPMADAEIDFIARLDALKPKLLEAITQDQAVLTHSDLHGEHIFEQDGRLTGVIDFGASFISIPAWDFAVMAYYHGWASVEESLFGYTSSAQAQDHQLKQAQKLALAVGLYKLAKGAESQKPSAKLIRIVNFVKQSLETLEKNL
ncbi:MAG: phosphotransferase [Chloroflexota bacterium]